ncbi:MAG TPA: sigma 54-interacting transcriptional regulator, partial [Planctomycetota bacterium]|nr:sigma 54-interacting transcriptional regulator [Planctomycetota bacterium]
PRPAVAQDAGTAAVARALWVDAAALTLDGDCGEWRGDGPPAVRIDSAAQLVALEGRAPSALWSGPQDASLSLWLGWTEEDLLLGGEVRDDVTDNDPAQWFRGDSLELFLGVGERTPSWGAGDFQVMLAPDWPARPWGVYGHDASTPQTGDGGFGGVEVASQPFLGGYRFEVRLPWRNFAGYVPRAGAELLFDFALCDRDGRGRQESYGTWRGVEGLAAFADRRGILLLEPAPAGRRSVGTAVVREPRPRLLLLGLLALTYTLALVTRGVWRRPRAKLFGLVGAAALLAGTAGASFYARRTAESAASQRSEDLVAYWGRFESLVRSRALGHPEPQALVAMASDLLSGGSIAPLPSEGFVHLTPAGAELGPELATARRALPYRQILLPGASAPGAVLGPGESLTFELGARRDVTALPLVTRIGDARAADARERTPLLAVELSLEGGALETRELRQGQELHHEGSEHRDYPGLEPAFFAPGGRLGRVHGDGMLLDLRATLGVDRVVVRHVGASDGYPVRVLAAAVRTPLDVAGDARAAPPPGLRPTADGEWAWSERRPEIQAEVTLLGRATPIDAPDRLVRRLSLGSEPLALVRLVDSSPPLRPARLDGLPLGTAAFVAPFLVALVAEWLAKRRRIRGKLAVGFAVTSAVPLLALTLLLEASLGQEHETFGRQRAEQMLGRAQLDLERQRLGLEREAHRLLRIAELEKRVRGDWPERSADLESWWGAGDGSLRLFERIGSDGRRLRVGSGAHWREVPADFVFKSGLQRTWGQLWLCGVAQTASGADQPLTVVVARAPELADARRVEGELAGSRSATLRLIGAGRDPRPQSADLASAGPRELRTPLYGAQSGELAGVLVAGWGERGVPVLGEYSLIELLLAAGLSALFTALLFAGILTGHLVGPIERLDRAVRAGRATTVEPEIEDEIGHLARAIRSASSELGQRVSQLETLQTAGEQLSRHLDLERAREAVLRFFDLHARPTSLWLLWTGESGEVPRLFALGGRDGVVSRALPEGPGLLARAAGAGQVLRFTDAPGLPALPEAERELFGDVASVLALPLSVAGGRRGALLFGFRASEREPDQAFLRAASSQAATVLENARLYHQAVSDAVTGFLSDPAFRQRRAEEILRAQDARAGGVLVVRLRLSALPEDDARAAERLREAARRMRLAVRGMAVFGRSGSADLQVAIPWRERKPAFAVLERRIVDRVAGAPWPDGEEVAGLHAAHTAWPGDGPSARFVLHLAEERLTAVQAGSPLPSGAQLAERLPPDFVAGSPNMVGLLESLRRLAEQELTLLVSGETGSGKDRLAELVHRWSPRREGPLVHVHCPSLSASLIEDELFGHEKGAFTGADSRRMGPFEYASGGTVVLDEVGGLSLDGQVALLRVIESREVLPLGASRPVPIDVRLVATTSRDLAAEVEAGRFRSDLYFRLHVAQLSVPPLRLRRQALPELVEALVRRFNASADRPVTGVAPEVLDRLYEHSWPGNVRELENVLARALILAEGGELGPEHIDLESGYLPPDEVAGEGLNARQEALLEGLDEAGWITSPEHARVQGVSERTALRDLLDLVDRGWLVREGQRRGTRFRRVRGHSRAGIVQ